MFRGVDRHSNVQAGRLGDRTVALTVKHYAGAAGLDPAKYAGHSLRAGLVTSAALNNVPEYVIQRQTRHKSTDMLRRYIRNALPGAARHPTKAAPGEKSSNLREQKDSGWYILAVLGNPRLPIGV
jgi:integrase